MSSLGLAGDHDGSMPYEIAGALILTGTIIGDVKRRHVILTG